MVEALFAHGFDGFGTGGGGGDGGDGFEAERGDCRAVEGVFLDTVGAGAGAVVRGASGDGWCEWEKVICCEPVVVDKLSS